MKSILLIIIIAIIIIAIIAGLGLLGCSGNRPDGLEIVDGRLPPCPNRPNCVSSQSDDPAHRIPPISYVGERGQAMARLEAVIREMPGATIVRRDADVLQVEFKTRVMGFVDDALFYFDDAEKTIHVRSASRIGYSDLGVNRKRIEQIRRRLLKPE